MAGAHAPQRRQLHPGRRTELLALAAEIPIVTEIQPFELDRANEALAALAGGRLDGTAVLVMPPDTGAG